MPMVCSLYYRIRISSKVLLKGAYFVVVNRKYLFC